MSVYSLCEVSRRFAVPLTAKKFMPLSVATALAINVLEHPGGPYSSTPLGGRMPMVVNNSGRCNGHSTASFRRAFTNCCPAKERERERACVGREREIRVREREFRESLEKVWRKFGKERVWREFYKERLERVWREFCKKRLQKEFGERVWRESLERKFGENVCE